MNERHTTVAQIIAGVVTLVALVFVGVCALQGKPVPAELTLMLGGGVVGSVTIPIRPGQQQQP